MDSNLIARIHVISVTLFLLTYLIKTILLFTQKKALDNYTRIMKVPEIIISVAFLVTGIWLYTILDGIKKIHFIKLALVFASIPIAVIAFKKYKKGLALLSLILIISAYGMAEMSKSMPFIPTTTSFPPDYPGDNLGGARIYMENCMFCHGENGRKMYRNAPDLTKSSFTEDGIMQLVRQGSRGKMPKYGLTFTDEELQSLANYVVSLRK